MFSQSDGRNMSYDYIQRDDNDGIPDALTRYALVFHGTPCMLSVKSGMERGELSGCGRSRGAVRGGEAENTAGTTRVGRERRDREREER